MSTSVFIDTDLAGDKLIGVAKWGVFIFVIRHQSIGIVNVSNQWKQVPLVQNSRL